MKFKIKYSNLHGGENCTNISEEIDQIESHDIWWILCNTPEYYPSIPEWNFIPGSKIYYDTNHL
jgi:hypothetical protein